MTQLAHRHCGVDYGCVIPGHTDASCYWRYFDGMMDRGMMRQILPLPQWHSQIEEKRAHSG